MTTVSRPKPGAELALDDLLELLREYHWTLHLFGPNNSPDLCAAARHWRSQSDVVLIRDETSASAYRTPMHEGVDLFAPKRVLWQYHSTPTWTLRAALSLPEPFHPSAPRRAEPAHVKCIVPQEFRRRESIRRTGLNQPPGWTWL